MSGVVVPTHSHNHKQHHLNKILTCKIWAVFERFFFYKTLKPLILKQDFERNRLKKPLKPLKSCFNLGEKSRLGSRDATECKMMNVTKASNYQQYQLFSRVPRVESSILDANFPKDPLVHSYGSFPISYPFLKLFYKIDQKIIRQFACIKCCKPLSTCSSLQLGFSATEKT